MRERWKEGRREGGREGGRKDKGETLFKHCAEVSNFNACKESGKVTSKTDQVGTGGVWGAHGL